MAKQLNKAPANVRPQAYVLKVTRNEVVAAAPSPQGLYYAAQTLRQRITNSGSIPCVSITDWPTYVHRGVMLDISRCKVPMVETLLDLIERLASMKINVFQLYTEHTFAFRRHPEIGRNCSPMTAEDIIEIDDFCKHHFVDLQANLQSFGHQAHMLSLPKYNHLAELKEKPWTFCPGDRRTYKLLDDMYSECLPAYSSKLFNASCDETSELGTGRSAARAKRMGIGRLYLSHIKKINNLAHKYGKRMMIWADIVMEHPECIPDIPKDIIVLHWGYDAGADLSSMWRLKEAGLEHWPCPGVSSWSRIFADVRNACANITERAVMGQKTGATGLLNTDWGDGGHPQMPSASYHGYAWGAEQSWTPNTGTRRADFDRRFAWAWFGDGSGKFGKLYSELNRITTAPRIAKWFYPFVLYWDKFPFVGLLKTVNPTAIKNMRARVRKAREFVRQLAETCPEHYDILDEVLFGLEQLSFVEKKIEASQKIKELRDDGRKKLPPPLKKTVRDLLQKWQDQRARFEELWMTTNRRSQIRYRLGEYKKRAADYKKLL